MHKWEAINHGDNSPVYVNVRQLSTNFSTRAKSSGLGPRKERRGNKRTEVSNLSFQDSRSTIQRCQQSSRQDLLAKVSSKRVADELVSTLIVLNVGQRISDVF